MWRVSAFRSEEAVPRDRLSTYLLEATVEVVASVAPRVPGVVFLHPPRQPSC